MLYGVRPQLQLDLVRQGQPRARRDPLRAGLVPVPDAAAGRAPGEPPVLRPERARRPETRPFRTKNSPSRVSLSSTDPTNLPLARTGCSARLRPTRAPCSAQRHCTTSRRLGQGVAARNFSQIAAAAAGPSPSLTDRVRESARCARGSSSCRSASRCSSPPAAAGDEDLLGRRRPARACPEGPRGRRDPPDVRPRRVGRRGRRVHRPVRRRTWRPSRSGPTATAPSGSSAPTSASRARTSASLDVLQREAERGAALGDPPAGRVRQGDRGLPRLA